MDFYDNLTGDGVFFFWIAIVLAVFLVGLAVFLLFKNKKLSKLLKDEKKIVAYPIDSKREEVIVKEEDGVHKEEIVEEKKEKTEAISPVVQKDVEEPIVLQIENKKEEPFVKEKETVKEEENNRKIENKNIEINRKEENKDTEVNKRIEDNRFKISDDIPKLFEPSKEVKREDNTNNSKPYQKNVLREMSKKMPISPIHIEKDTIDDDKDIYTVSSDIDDTYDLEGIDYGEDTVSPLEKMEDSYEADDKMKEIVSRMEEEVKPSNIELTDYEKKQEEEAIISYDELQKVKDKIYNLTEEEEDGEFIDELKNFRSDLE